MAALLRESGVPGDQIQLEETGTDTLSSVRAIRQLLRESHRIAHVKVATSPYHQPRCLLLLYLFGIAARPCPFPTRCSRTPWTRRWFWRLREIPAIPYDASWRSGGGFGINERCGSHYITSRTMNRGELSGRPAHRIENCRLGQNLRQYLGRGGVRAII